MQRLTIFKLLIEPLCKGAASFSHALWLPIFGWDRQLGAHHFDREMPYVFVA